jgi:hypothetical protein
MEDKRARVRSKSVLKKTPKNDKNKKGSKAMLIDDYLSPPFVNGFVIIVPNKKLEGEEDSFGDVDTNLAVWISVIRV